MDKNKINFVELTGNLAADAKVSGKTTFITVATYNGKDSAGKERPATFIEVAIFDAKHQALKKGDRVVVKGNLTNYKEKTTGFTKLGVVALSCQKVERQQNTEINAMLPTKESNLETVPWIVEDEELLKALGVDVSKVSSLANARKEVKQTTGEVKQAKDLELQKNISEVNKNNERSQ